MEKRAYYLVLSNVKGIGPARLQKLVSYFGDIENVWNADIYKWTEALGGHRKVAEEFVRIRSKIDIEKYHEYVLAKGMNYITINDPSYPSLLKQIYDPPQVLFFKGTLKKHPLNIAIVGSRSCSHYGKETAKYLANKLAERGVNVISGMARGIDTNAHLGTLIADGFTTAVLGSGLDVIYPPENKGLYDKITEGGVVISEYHPGTRPDGRNFPARNRIISGLSHGVIVIEAAEKSGSLITVDFALEQGRDVFAVPGNITSENSKGTNNLLKQGAKLVTDVDAIIEEYDGLLVTNDKHLEDNKIATNEKEELILNILADNVMDIDYLCVKSGLQSAEINTLLTIMELKGLINQVSGKKIVRNVF